MPKQGPLYEEGHLFVAAVRVLSHKENRPPTLDEVTELLNLSKEVVFLTARGLADRGILHLMENPFEIHVEIADHLAIEELPRDDTGPGFGEDLDEFHEKKKREQDEMGDFFKNGGMEKKKGEKLSKMEEEFRRFRRHRSGDDEEQE